MPITIMPGLKNKRQRASVEEVLDFANKVRAAGGGNPIDALMPSVPEDESACLIARNLNFNCEVSSGHVADWGMHVEDPDVAHKIGESLGLKVYGPESDEHMWTIDLPDRIGQVAHDFDNVSSVLYEVLDAVDADFVERFGFWPGLGDAIVYSDPEVPSLTDEQQKFVERRTKYYLRQTPKRLRQDVRELMPLVQESSAEARRLAGFVNADGSIVR